MKRSPSIKARITIWRINLIRNGIKHGKRVGHGSAVASKAGRLP